MHDLRIGLSCFLGIFGVLCGFTAIFAYAAHSFWQPLSVAAVGLGVGCWLLAPKGGV